MGGANTQQEKPIGTPATEAATYAQLKKQGMSGSSNESLGNYYTTAKDFVKDFVGKPTEIPVAKNEEQAIEQLNKQGMSGMPDESLAHYLKIGKDIYADLRSQASSLISPNLFGRDVSAPATQETQNK